MQQNGECRFTIIPRQIILISTFPHRILCSIPTPTEYLLEGIPVTRKLELTRDILSTWEGIANGVVDKNHKTREKYWACWTRYTQAFRKHPHLTDCSATQQIIIITAFAARVWTGYYGLGNRVRVKTVAGTLSAISKTIELAGFPSPVYQTEKIYKIPVARLIEGYRREDPPAVPQLAIPASVPDHCRKRTYSAGSNEKKKAIGNLTIIAFFYLLRVGEYTKPHFTSKQDTIVRTTRTIQFSVGNVDFFRQNKILARGSPLGILLTAESCTLKITNQKNGRMGQTIHYHAIDKDCCPVKALARRVHHILTNGGSTATLLCNVCHNTTWSQITSKEIVLALRAAVTQLDLHVSGINPQLVGAHSLRAGDTMALKLTGQDDTTRMEVGRWTSLTFLQYIHNQIAHLSIDLANDMSTNLQFTNIAAIEQ